MTDMRRITIALPDDLDNKILALRKDNRFLRCSYSEIVRRAMEHGLDMLQAEGEPQVSRQNSA